MQKKNTTLWGLWRKTDNRLSFHKPLVYNYIQREKNKTVLQRQFIV